jgi:nitroreductase
MELYDAIYRRRAVRHYTATAVPPALVRELLAAAAQAPSAQNLQPWAFGVFAGRRRLLAYSAQAKAFLLTTGDPALALHQTDDLYADPDHDLFHGAGTLIVIFARRGDYHPAEDCCLAAENLLLAAAAENLTTCPIGCVRPWLNSLAGRRALGHADDWQAVFPVVVGYAQGETPAVPRHEPEILTWVGELT